MVLERCSVFPHIFVVAINRFSRPGTVEPGLGVMLTLFARHFITHLELWELRLLPVPRRAENFKIFNPSTRSKCPKSPSFEVPNLP